MEEFMRKGDVVVLPFPFSDLSISKKRPALIVANLKGDDVILCQITSQHRKDNYSVTLHDKDFKKGKLNQKSRIRPNRLFTAEKSIILYKIGKLKQEKINQVQEHLIRIIRE